MKRDVIRDARVTLADTPCTTHAATRLHDALAALVAEIDAAPVREVHERGVFEHHDGVIYNAPNDMIGQRVALLRVGEGT